MKPEKIKAIRAELRENTAAFGQRFHRSGRTVEDWEQGRCTPDPLVVAEMERLAARLERKKNREKSR